MSSFKIIRDSRAKLHERRGPRKLANLAADNSHSPHLVKMESKLMELLPVPSAYPSDTASGSLDLGSFSGSFDDLIMKPLSVYSMDDSRGNLSSVGFEKESATLRRRNIRRRLGSKHRSHSSSTLYQPQDCTPGWIAELKIYTVYDINTSIVRDGTNTCIKIRQDFRRLGKTTVKVSSSQQVWEETFKMPITEISQPIWLEYYSRKAGRFSILGAAELSLDECIVGVTYSKHLELLSPGSSKLIGMLRMQVCLQSCESTPSVVRKNFAMDDGHRAYKPRLHLKSRSSSMLNNPSSHTEKVGPLKAGVQTFEARYLGLLHLNVVTRRFSMYARRWSPLEYQPGEVAVITNPLTKATEIVSPRLPWPPHFLRGVSALEFDPITGPQVARFDSAVLYINVLSVCGLQSIPLAKFLSKCDTAEKSDDSMHRGVIAARLISYYQSTAKNEQPLSTQVQLQMGRDKYLTTIKKSTFDPVWNQMFTFNLSNDSKTLIEVQLMSIANPNITGLAAGMEKIGEALIDVSRLPMDFTQRIEIELNGKRPKPRLLVLATLTGLSKSETPSFCITPSSDSNVHQSDFESNIESTRSIQRNTPRGSLYSNTETTTPDSEEWSAPTIRVTPEKYSLDETDAQIVKHYGWKMALKNRFDVGFLRVNVIAASGLADRDVNGKCDAFCLLELINMRAQTQTVKKTFNPKWDKVFVFPVTDVHTVLYVTVYEDEKYKSEFIGRVAIPLMKVRNHERSWYALKNADLTERSRGSILLEFFFVYNHFKAAWRTLNPIEACLNHPVRPKKYKKLSAEYTNAIRKNVMRLKVIFKPLGIVTQIVDDICSWENPWCTIGVLIGYNTVVWNFQPYMIPLDALNSVKSITGAGAGNRGPTVDRAKFFGPQNSQLGDDVPNMASPQSSFDCETNVFINNELLYSLRDEFSSEDENQELEKTTTESKESKHGKKKFNAVMDVVGDLPQIMDLIASAIEKTIGIFEWQVPWLTWFSLFFLMIFTIILYLVPLRVVLCIIGTNQLTRKLLRPSSRSTFATFNVISRVPSRPEAEQQRRLAPRSFVYQ